MEPPRYEIRTVADFVALPPEKIGAFLTDFAEWLKVVHVAKGLKDAGLVLKSPLDVFSWIDDGKHEMTLTVHDQSGVELERDVFEFAPPEEK
jgi:hypothetical protein